MSTTDLFFLSIALAMDAFAVSIVKGMYLRHHVLSKALLLAVSFGFFQGLMPYLGYLLGGLLDERLQALSHILSFLLLVFLGVQMLKEKQEEDESTDLKTILILAVATSLDAMAAGLSLAFLDSDILFACAHIMVITAGLCFLGVLFGRRLHHLIQDRATYLGGLILIAIGLKIIIDHFLTMR